MLVKSGLISIVSIFILGLLITSCGGGSKRGDPISPSDTKYFRNGMDFFNGTETVFGGGTDDDSADVDLAPVVWGQISSGSGDLGSTVVFENDNNSRWAMAVAIEDPDGDPPNGASFPVIAFLKYDDSEATDVIGTFDVTLPDPQVDGQEARLPRIDCQYAGNNTIIAYVRVITESCV